MAKKVIRQFQGLLTNPNQLELPEGALLAANNVSLLRPGVIRPRKGFDTHSVIDISAENIHRLIEHEGITYAHWDDGGGTSKLSYHNGAIWSAYPGTYGHPEGDSFKLTAARLGTSLYFAEEQGIRRIDAPSTGPVFAGVAKCQGISRPGSTVTASATGVLPTESQRAYRATLAYKRPSDDAMIEGAPSGPTVLRNESTTQNGAPTLLIPLPALNGTDTTPLNTDHWIRVYASSTTALDVEPSDDCALIYEAQLTSVDIAAGEVAVDDVTPDVLRGSALYTNSAQQGIGQANEPPPSARCIAEYKGCILLANTYSRPRLELQVLAVGGSSGIQVGDVFGLDDSNGTNFTLTATVGVPGVGEYKLETAGTLTASQQVALTVQNLCAAINKHTGNTFCYAYYLGNAADPRSIGRFVLEHRKPLSGANFTVLTAYVGAGDNNACFEPSLPQTNNASVGAAADIWPNGWALSKVGIGDGFPLLQTGRMGPGSVIAIGTLDDAAFLFHDSGEVWALTGEPAVDGLGGSLRMERWRTGLTLLAPGTVRQMDGALLALTDQGVVSITPSGYTIISEPISRTLADAVSDAGSFVRSHAWAAVHPVDRRYELGIYTGDVVGGVQVWKRFVFHAESGTWSTGDAPLSAGTWHAIDRRLWLGFGDTAFRENVGTAATDYGDDGKSISSTITLPPFVAGDGATGKQLREVQVVFEGSQPSGIELTVATEHGSDSVDVATQGTNVARMLVPRSVQRGMRHNITLAIDSDATEWRISSIVLLYNAYAERGTK